MSPVLTYKKVALFLTAIFIFFPPIIKINTNPPSSGFRNSALFFNPFREDDPSNIETNTESLYDSLKKWDVENQKYKEAQKKLESKLTDVTDFEVKLANISPQRLGHYSKDTLVPYSIHNLSQKFSFLSWTDFFDSMLQATTSQGK